jgi:hypothetical protein
MLARKVTVLVGVTLLGCATPYQRRGVLGGYEDESIGPGQWLVTVQVNGYTSRGTATRYAYRRARELCGRGGFVELSQGQYGSSFVYVNRGTIWAGTKPEVVLAVQCNEPTQRVLVGPDPQPANSRVLLDCHGPCPEGTRVPQWNERAKAPPADLGDQTMEPLSSPEPDPGAGLFDTPD